MDIKPLRLFIAVAEDLNFSRAAARLGMAQPPLSLAIKNLEQELGVRLLDRTRRSVTLTRAGAAFLVEARRSIAQLERSAHVARQVSAGRAGTLRIAYVSSAPYHFLPSVLTRFHRKFPDIDFDLQEWPSLELIRLVENDQVDVAILRSVLGTRLKLRTVIGCRESFVVALPRRHRLARRTLLRLADLAEEAFVSFSAKRSPSLHQQLLMACRTAGFTPRIHQEAAQLQSIMSLVAAGLGIALVPSSIQHLNHPEIAFRRLRDRTPWLSSELIVAMRDDNPMPAAREFLKIASAIPALR